MYSLTWEQREKGVEENRGGGCWRQYEKQTKLKRWTNSLIVLVFFTTVGYKEWKRDERGDSCKVQGQGQIESLSLCVSDTSSLNLWTHTHTKPGLFQWVFILVPQTRLPETPAWNQAKLVFSHFIYSILSVSQAPLLHLLFPSIYLS